MNFWRCGIHVCSQSFDVRDLGFFRIEYDDNIRGANWHSPAGLCVNCSKDERSSGWREELDILNGDVYGDAQLVYSMIYFGKKQQSASSPWHGGWRGPLPACNVHMGVGSYMCACVLCSLCKEHFRFDNHVEVVEGVKEPPAKKLRQSDEEKRQFSREYD